MTTGRRPLVDYDASANAQRYRRGRDMTFFQPVRETLSRYGLTLVTG